MFWTFFFSELRCSLVDHQRHIVPGICSISNARNTNSEKRENTLKNIQFKKNWQENMLQKSGLSNWFWKCFILRPDLDIEQNIKEISRKTIKLSNNFLQILVSNCPQVSILILSWMSPGSLDQFRIQYVACCFGKLLVLIFLSP